MIYIVMYYFIVCAPSRKDSGNLHKSGLLSYGHKSVTCLWTFTSLDPTCRDIDEVFLRRLASHIGDEWHALGIHLGFRPDQIERLGRDYLCTEDKIFNMLVTWKQAQIRSSDCKEILDDALTHCGRADLAVNLYQIAGKDGKRFLIYSI